MSQLLEQARQKRLQEAADDAQQRELAKGEILEIAIREIEGRSEPDDASKLAEALDFLEWSESEYEELLGELEPIPEIIGRIEECRVLQSEIVEARASYKALKKEYEEKLKEAWRYYRRRESSVRTLHANESRLLKIEGRFPFLFEKQLQPIDAVLKLKPAPKPEPEAEPPVVNADEPQEAAATPKPSSGKSGNRTPSAADLPTAQRK